MAKPIKANVKLQIPGGAANPAPPVGSALGQHGVNISWKDVEDIAKVKMADLNAHDIEQAKKIIAGSARSMGIEVKD